MTETAQNGREWRDIPVPHDTPGQNTGERVWRDIPPRGTSPAVSDSEAERTKAVEALAGHMHEYDSMVRNAHDFVKDTLGMQDVCSVSRVAVLPEEAAEEGSSGGGFSPVFNVARVFKPSSGRSKTDELQLVVNLVHELAHSATVTPENAATVHSFYHEAFAGLAEYYALQNLTEASRFSQPPDKRYTREIDGEEVTIIIPGRFRRAEVLELTDDQTESTQALIAATVVGIGLAKIGQPARDVLAMTRHDDSAAYDVLRDAVASIDPELPEYIDRQPRYDTDAIIQIAHKAQQAARLIP